MTHPPSGPTTPPPPSGPKDHDAAIFAAVDRILADIQPPTPGSPPPKPSPTPPYPPIPRFTLPLPSGPPEFACDPYPPTFPGSPPGPPPPPPPDPRLYGVLRRRD